MTVFSTTPKPARRQAGAADEGTLSETGWAVSNAAMRIQSSPARAASAVSWPRYSAVDLSGSCKGCRGFFLSAFHVLFCQESDNRTL